MNELEDLVGKTIKVSCGGGYRWIKVEGVEEDGKNGRSTIDGQLVRSTNPGDDIERYNEGGECGVWAYTEQIV